MRPEIYRLIVTAALSILLDINQFSEMAFKHYCVEQIMFYSRYQWVFEHAENRAKTMYKGMKLVLLLMSIIWPGFLWGDTLVESLLSSYRLTPGITLKSTDFDVYNKGSTSTNGTLSEDFAYWPFVVLGSPYKYFGESNWGGLMEYSFSGFKLNQQLVNDELVDLGTSVKGYHAFVTPTLFYSFSGQRPHGKYDQTVIAGLGVGLGYLNASGDIIFTESTQQRFDIDVSGTALAISLFVDYRFGSFTTRISGRGTTYTEGGFDYDAFGFAWSFGYIFGL